MSVVVMEGRTRLGGNFQALRWDADTCSWWWIDGAAGLLCSSSLDEDEGMPHLRPDEASAFAHCQSGDLLFCQPKRLCVGKPTPVPRRRGGEGWRLWPLAAVDAAEPRTSIYDGCTDRSGNFVFGTRNEGADGRAIGSFYQYSQQYGLRRLALPTVTRATSICFSVDGARMYFADGALHRILQCDYCASSAQVSNIRALSSTDALPEGAVVDARGNVWSAQAQAGRVVQYSPEGVLIHQYSIPLGSPGVPSFGGTRLDQLLIASADGVVRIAAAGVVGVADVRFDDRGRV